MMYFLVSMPPKISCAVRPDFSATSVKLAIGAADGVAAFVCWAQTSAHENSEQAQASAHTRRSRAKNETLRNRMVPSQMVGAASATVKLRAYRLVARLQQKTAGPTPCRCL